MRAYNKPEFYIEEFLPNVVVAACSTTLDPNNFDVKWDEQAIICAQSNNTTEYIFSTTSVCDHVPCHMVFIPNDTASPVNYTEAQLIAAGLTNIITNSSNQGGKPGSTGSSGGVTIPAGGTYVICWGDGDHYGIPSATIVNRLINSY